MSESTGDSIAANTTIDNGPSPKYRVRVDEAGNRVLGCKTQIAGDSEREEAAQGLGMRVVWQWLVSIIPGGQETTALLTADGASLSSGGTLGGFRSQWLVKPVSNL